MIKKMLIVALLAGFVMPMVACNTTKGLGKDTEKAGESMQSAAERHGAD